MALRGQTVFITGASRGIGLSIAVRCAKEGANVAIAAKTTEPHPKLPGTIFTAAQEVEKAGGKALPLVCDIRDEAQVEQAVKQTVEKFGGLDILVNNASAIFLRGTMDTPGKRWDLMHNINARGTYVTTRACLPHLLAAAEKGRNSHVLNISPPLNMSQRWFKDHVAYTMAKYGMSMCVLGMSGEFEGRGVAINALWPRTGIATAAIEFITGDSSMKYCRKPEIMADAAVAIFRRNSKDKKNNGNFYIDDEVLAQDGVKDFDQYAVCPGEPLMPDFFLDDPIPTNLPKEALTGHAKL